MSDRTAADEIELVVDDGDEPLKIDDVDGYEIATEMDRCVTGTYTLKDDNDSLEFNSWDEVAVYAAEQCEDGITLDDFKDACSGIEYPAQRIEGFVMTIDGNAGLSCDDLQRIAEYKEMREDGR